MEKINTSSKVLSLSTVLLLLGACQTLPKFGQTPQSTPPQQAALSQFETEADSSTVANLEVSPVIIEPSVQLPAEHLSLALAEIAAQELQQAMPADADAAQTVDAVVIQEIQQEVEAALKENNNAWLRLQRGMQMPETMNDRIQAQLKGYLKHPRYLQRVMERAKPVLPLILDTLEQKGLPTELALLPIVESAYQTFAYSHGRASGMWQIIPSTGRYLGLKQNWWYDGRRDIIESTRAATDYLQSLAAQFNNDWELALASYNAGPGKIRSAIRYNKKKGRETDFWHLTRLRRETLDYVPKLLALKEIFAHPEKYELELPHVEDELVHEIVELDSQIDLALAADLAGITTDELYQLNPAFNRWATAPDGPHRLLLPSNKAEAFKQKLAETPKQKRINWVRYKIKQGDTLSVIARRYQTTASLIRKVNRLRGNHIRAGKHLLIPTATQSLNQYSLSQSARTAKIKNTKRGGSKITHTVQSGESFWSISRRYGVNSKSLAKWNGMAPIDTLRVGQKLVVWQKAGKASARQVSMLEARPKLKMHALRYTVRKGDSLSRIADKFNIRVADIKKWNRVGKYLQPGQKLKLFVDITSQSG